MKKLILFLLFMLMGCTSAKEDVKIMRDFVDADNIMVYYRASDEIAVDEDINMTSFHYPIKANLGTNIEDTPQDEFYAQVNDLTTRLNKNIFDIMQVSSLETAAEASFDENNEGYLKDQGDGKFNIKEASDFISYLIDNMIEPEAYEELKGRYLDSLAQE